MILNLGNGLQYIVHLENIIDTMKPCPLCGSEAAEEQWSAASEIRGTCWQDGYLDCSNPECHHGVSIHIDSDVTHNASELLEALWDKMTEYVKKPIKNGFMPTSANIRNIKIRGLE